MNQKQIKTFNRMVDETTSQALLDLWKRAFDECDDIYKAMLLRLREKIDEQLANVEKKGGSQ